MKVIEYVNETNQVIIIDKVNRELIAVSYDEYKELCDSTVKKDKQGDVTTWKLNQKKLNKFLEKVG